MPPAAATRRTTPAKKAATNVVDFDAARKAKKSPAKKKAQLKYGGKLWDLKEPNVAVTAELEASESIAAIIGYAASFIVKAQREDFVKALAADEDLDFEVLNDLTNAIMAKVYGEIPT